MKKKLIALILSAVVAPLALTTTFAVVRAKQTSVEAVTARYIVRIEENYGLHINMVKALKYIDETFMDLDIRCALEVKDFDYSSFEKATSQTTISKPFDSYFPLEETYTYSMRFEGYEGRASDNNLDIFFNPNTSILGLFEWNV